MSPSQRRFAIAGVLVAASESILYLSWSRIDDNDPFPSLEMQLGFVAAVSIFLIPHVLAYMAGKGRPSLYVASGVLGILVTIASAISPVLLMATVPLILIPSSVRLMRHRRSPKPRVRAGATTLIVVAMAVGAAFSLFMSGSDERCYTVARQPDGTLRHTTVDSSTAITLGPNEVEGGCSSDVFALYESVASLTLHLLVYRVAWELARPSPRPLLA